MIAIFKNPATFETSCYAPPQSFTLPADTVTDDKGQVTFSKDKVKGVDGFWMIFKEVYFVGGTAQNDPLITVTALSPENAFSRNTLYDYSSFSTTGEFLTSALTNLFKVSGDAKYAMPYLNIVNTSTRSLLIPPKNDDGTYNLASYIRYVRKHGVSVGFSASGYALTISIADENQDSIILVEGDGKTVLKSEAYSSTRCEKVTVIKSGISTDYYLNADGSAITSIPAERQEGTWKTVVVGDDEETTSLQAAQEMFASNTKSQKIEFYNPEKFKAYSDITLSLKSGIVKSKISCVWKTSENDKYLYRVGDLATTLTEKVKSNGN